MVSRFLDQITTKKMETLSDRYALESYLLAIGRLFMKNRSKMVRTGACGAVLAGALALSGVLHPAFAGSVTQPGERIGLAAGAPLPQGFYFVDTTDFGGRNGPSDETVGVTIPVIVWATPYHLLGARIQALAAPPLVEASTPGSHVQGFYNPLIQAQLAWNLGGGFGASYALGAYIGVDSPVADQSTSLNQWGALSYTGGGYDLTASAIYGTQISSHTNPDFFNLDLTATKSFGKWSAGPVGYYSTDLNQPFPTYRKQNQFALGALVGYNFGPVILQTYLTRTVSENNYGGQDTRFWFRIIVPLGA